MSELPVYQTVRLSRGTDRYSPVDMVGLPAIGFDRPVLTQEDESFHIVIVNGSKIWGILR